MRFTPHALAAIFLVSIQTAECSWMDGAIESMDRCVLLVDRSQTRPLAPPPLAVAESVPSRPVEPAAFQILSDEQRVRNESAAASLRANPSLLSRTHGPEPSRPPRTDTEGHSELTSAPLVHTKDEHLIRGAKCRLSFVGNEPAVLPGRATNPAVKSATRSSHARPLTERSDASVPVLPEFSELPSRPPTSILRAPSNPDTGIRRSHTKTARLDLGPVPSVRAPLNARVERAADSAVRQISTTEFTRTPITEPKDDHTAAIPVDERRRGVLSNGRGHVTAPRAAVHPALITHGTEHLTPSRTSVDQALDTPLRAPKMALKAAADRKQPELSRELAPVPIPVVDQKPITPAIDLMTAPKTTVDQALITPAAESKKASTTVADHALASQPETAPRDLVGATGASDVSRNIIEPYNLSSETNNDVHLAAARSIYDNEFRELNVKPWDGTSLVQFVFAERDKRVAKYLCALAAQKFALRTQTFLINAAAMVLGNKEAERIAETLKTSPAHLAIDKSPSDVISSAVRQSLQAVLTLVENDSLESGEHLNVNPAIARTYLLARLSQIGASYETTLEELKALAGTDGVMKINPL